MSWLGFNKNVRGILPTIAKTVEYSESDVGPKACKMENCFTLRERDVKDNDDLYEILQYLDDIDLSKLVSAIAALKEKNYVSYHFVMATPHIFLENVGISRAVLIVGVMKKYVCYLHHTVSFPHPEECKESNFATYCYIAAKAFNIYNGNGKWEVEQLANYISAMIDWNLDSWHLGMMYPETIGSILNADDGAKCYRQLTLRQAKVLTERIEGLALHKSTIFSAELINSLKEPANDDDCAMDIVFQGYEFTSSSYDTTMESLSMIFDDDDVYFKKINVATDPGIVLERLKKLKTANGIITDRTPEVFTAVTISITLTLALIVASSTQIKTFNDNGIDVTSLWSLWTIIVALCLNLFIATVTTDWNWYYFLRLKSIEKNIGPRHLAMINCCKHDFLHALSEEYLTDIMKVVNEGTSFLPDSSRNGDIALNLNYDIEDLQLVCACVFKHYSGGYRLSQGLSFKTLVPSDRLCNSAHFTAQEHAKYMFSGKRKVTSIRLH